MSVTEEEFQKVSRLIEAENVITSFEFAALAILVWDWFLTIDIEVRLVWPNRWTFGKFLFFLTRYLPFADVLLSISYIQFTNDANTQTCWTVYVCITWLEVVGIQIAQLILLLRSWALSGRNFALLIFLLIFQFALLVYAGIASHTFVNSIQWAGKSLGGIHGCSIISADTRLLSGSFAGIVAFEVSVLVVVLVYTLRRDRCSKLMGVIYRDGIIFFLFTVFVAITNMVVFFVASPEYTVTLIVFQRVMHSVTTGRILLHLREAAAGVVRILKENDGVWDLDEFHGGVLTHDELPLSRLSFAREEGGVEVEVSPGDLS